ncbi:phage major capsid protein [Bremerella sp. T1]|uniref:phage major capsid protein n=1 Tax=Bremerella sp. TYQ1 TaxID=3119568 RepID=UPI001CCC5C28|nr:phage major capsid protein [Bremerella volcania]UBM38370.1 phage major capsid protein [Bremerella volcania]
MPAIIASPVDNPFESPADFLSAVESATSSHRNHDPRLREFYRTRMQANGGGNTLEDPHGGFLMPAEWSPLVQSLNFEDPTDRFVRVVQASTPNVKVPARFSAEGRDSSSTGGLLARGRLETQADEPSRMNLKRIELSPRYLGGVSFATNQLVRAATPQFTELLAASFREELAWETLNHRINGTGVGEPQGALNSACKIVAPKEGGQNANTITGNNIVNMAKRCWNYERAIWLANHDTMPQLAQAHLAGTNSDRFLFTQGGQSFMLNCRPVYFTEFARSLGTEGDLILGTWGEYLVCVLGGFRGEASVHVRFVERETAFRFWIEIDSRPWWETQLTPRYGSNQLSPFITLETRD